MSLNCRKGQITTVMGEGVISVEDKVRGWQMPMANSDVAFSRCNVESCVDRLGGWASSCSLVATVHIPSRLRQSRHCRRPAEVAIVGSQPTVAVTPETMSYIEP